MAAYTVDILAVGFFILEWTVYAVTLEHSAYGRDSPARVLLRVVYLGWFVSPWVLFLTTAAVLVVTWRRQFAPNAWRAMES
jgi:uncharacterized membrane protein